MSPSFPTSMEHRLVAGSFLKAAAILREAAAVIEERDAAYGDNSVEHAKLSSLLLGGVPPGDAQKASMFNMILIKLSRYTGAARRGERQDDSLIDIINYTAALLAIDREQLVSPGDHNSSGAA